MTIIAASKDPNEIVTYELNWLKFIETIWQANKRYPAASYVRPSERNGYEYECTTAGESLKYEPNWTTTIGDTVSDGTAVWTCRANTNAALDDIAASYWEGTNLLIGDGVETVNIPLVGIVTPAATTNDVANTTVTIYGGSLDVDGSITNRIKTVAGKVYDQTLTIPIVSN